ncbi:PIN domain-containing protein [Nocardioides sp. WS12]|uniref:type II toxin-antitoxin system VapC family toxin n=1 Tax=Nocardioides sp. WS12 TaxID=2486272 RepID=UPI0015F968B6|nr:PIN domain-containing protein [Nocardioides sp. WS12]
MTTTDDEARVERVLLDTNVFLSATDTSRRSHAAALSLLENDGRALVVIPQIIREYLVVATRPLDVNGYGLPGPVAATNLDELLVGIDVLPETTEGSTLLRALVVTGRATGKQVHDANLVAMGLVHQVDVIVTDNARHFERFASTIRIESLAD